MMDDLMIILNIAQTTLLLGIFVAVLAQWEE